MTEPYNEELLLKAKEAILNNQDNFNMNKWGFEDSDDFSEEELSKGPVECGTACCIAGWIAFIAEPEKWPHNTTNNHAGEAAEILFMGNWHPDVRVGGDIENITPDQAAKAIDHFIENDGWPDMNCYHPDYR